jgi:hypothetical protein
MTKDEVNDLILNVYNARVDADSGAGSAARMMERDNDGGRKQRARALFYQPIVLEVLVQLGLYVRHLPPKRGSAGP